MHITQISKKVPSKVIQRNTSITIHLFREIQALHTIHLFREIQAFQYIYSEKYNHYNTFIQRNTSITIHDFREIQALQYIYSEK